MTKTTLIKVSLAALIIIGLVIGGFSLNNKQENDPRVVAAQEAAQHLQERLEVISQINDHKYAIEQLKVREAELQTLENEAKKKSIENASGYNYLETSF